MRWTRVGKALQQPGTWLDRIVASSSGEGGSSGEETPVRRRRAFTPRWQRPRTLRLALSYALSISLVVGAATLPFPAGDSATDASSLEVPVDSREQVRHKRVHAMAVSVRPEPEKQEASQSPRSGTRSGGTSSASDEPALVKVKKIEALPTGESTLSDTTLTSTLGGHRVEALTGMGERPHNRGRGKKAEDNDGFNVTIQFGSGGSGCITGPRPSIGF